MLTRYLSRYAFLGSNKAYEVQNCCDHSIYAYDYNPCLLRSAHGIDERHCRYADNKHTYGGHNHAGNIKHRALIAVPRNK